MKIKWVKINESTDSEIARENTKSNTQRFNESYDSAHFKEKFLDITMNELGFSEDEIEGLIEQWN